MMDLLNSWGSVNDLEGLMEDYRIETWDSKRGERYVIETSTNSGFKVTVEGKVDVYISGVTYDSYYGEGLVLSLEDDLLSLLDDLFEKEKLNKERLSNMKVLLSDLFLRKRVLEGEVVS